MDCKGVCNNQSTTTVRPQQLPQVCVYFSYLSLILHLTAWSLELSVVFHSYVLLFVSQAWLLHMNRAWFYSALFTAAPIKEMWCISCFKITICISVLFAWISFSHHLSPQLLSSIVALIIVEWKDSCFLASFPGMVQFHAQGVFYFPYPPPCWPPPASASRNQALHGCSL